MTATTTLPGQDENFQENLARWTPNFLKPRGGLFPRVPLSKPLKVRAQTIELRRVAPASNSHPHPCVNQRDPA